MSTMKKGYGQLPAYVRYGIPAAAGVAGGLGVGGIYRNRHPSSYVNVKRGPNSQIKELTYRRPSKYIAQYEKELLEQKEANKTMGTEDINKGRHKLLRTLPRRMKQAYNLGRRARKPRPMGTGRIDIQAGRLNRMENLAYRFGMQPKHIQQAIPAGVGVVGAVGAYQATRQNAKKVLGSSIMKGPVANVSSWIDYLPGSAKKTVPSKKKTKKVLGNTMNKGIAPRGYNRAVKALKSIYARRGISGFGPTRLGKGWKEDLVARRSSLPSGYAMAEGLTPEAQVMATVPAMASQQLSRYARMKNLMARNRYAKYGIPAGVIGAGVLGSYGMSRLHSQEHYNNQYGKVMGTDMNKGELTDAVNRARSSLARAGAVARRGMTAYGKLPLYAKYGIPASVAATAGGASLYMRHRKRTRKILEGDMNKGIGTALLGAGSKLWGGAKAVGRGAKAAGSYVKKNPFAAGLAVGVIPGYVAGRIHETDEGYYQEDPESQMTFGDISMEARRKVVSTDPHAPSFTSGIREKSPFINQAINYGKTAWKNPYVKLGVAGAAVAGGAYLASKLLHRRRDSNKSMQSGDIHKTLTPGLNTQIKSISRAGRWITRNPMAAGAIGFGGLAVASTAGAYYHGKRNALKGKSPSPIAAYLYGGGLGGIVHAKAYEKYRKSLPSSDIQKRINMLKVDAANKLLNEIRIERARNVVRKNLTPQVINRLGELQRNPWSI